MRQPFKRCALRSGQCVPPEVNKGMAIAAVLIDLDGTLVDTVPDLTASVDAMLRRLGRSPAGDTKVRHWVGNGVEPLVSRAIGERAHTDSFISRQAIEIFYPIYRANNGRHSRLYPGVMEALDCLRTRGIKIGCVTNKPRAFTLPLLATLGILEHFAAVVSGDDTSAKKPDPRSLIFALDLLGTKPEEALFVGDSIHDVEASRRASVPIACVTYGYNHGNDISASSPDFLIENLSDVEYLLDRVSHASA